MTPEERKRVERMAEGIALLRAENAAQAEDIRRYREFIAKVAGGPGRMGYARYDDWAQAMGREAHELIGRQG